VQRFCLKLGTAFANLCTNISWAYARKNYGYMTGIMVASRIVGDRMIKNGMKNIHLVPLGVDLGIFGPRNKDAGLIKKLKAGLPERLTIFFPHRFCGEKGTDTLIKAYPGICEALGHEPSVTFAGTGPYLDMVKKAADKYEHINYIGFVKDPAEMAKWYASTEIGLALSGWETFGLSIMEAMASGQVQIGANSACSLEHITNGKCGIVIPPGNVKELVRAVKQIVTENRFDELSRNAISYASRFGWNECFQKEMDIFTGKQHHKID
jgi:alpha-1,6-mannosyltransferase